jgi:nicotinate-nucleotide adenylyltransferase
MARLWFGGSFNPIHHGHLICARTVAEVRGFEKVVLVPTYQPPHKLLGPQIATPEDRLAMCRLAVQGSSLFGADDLELRRGGPSFTIDTVRELKRRGESEVHWLIGADMVQILPQWHEPEALLAETRFVLMARPGWSFDWNRLPPPYRSLCEQVVTTPLIEISATGIRNRVAAGQSVNYLLPEAVVKYIEQRGLYRDDRTHA